MPNLLLILSDMYRVTSSGPLSPLHLHSLLIDNLYGVPMVKKRGILHKFYFIEPKENVDAEKLAERLISLKPVEEVFLTDGDVMGIRGVKKKAT